MTALLPLCRGVFSLVFFQITQMSISIRTAVIAVVAGIAGTLLCNQLITDHVAYLNQATAEQCITHSWPAEAHQIHMDWCADNGYATK